MASVRKPRRRRNGFMDGPDQVLRLNSIYRTSLFGAARARVMARSAHAEFDDVVTPEPVGDLDDSDISDRERREAIARERTRREGRT